MCGSPVGHGMWLNAVRTILPHFARCPNTFAAERVFCFHFSLFIVSLFGLGFSIRLEASLYCTLGNKYFFLFTRSVIFSFISSAIPCVFPVSELFCSWARNRLYHCIPNLLIIWSADSLLVISPYCVGAHVS